MKQKILLGTLILFAASLWFACGTSTKLTAHWGDKEYEKGRIKKILILGIAKRESIRRIFEDDMVEKLEYYGVVGFPSSQLFPIGEKLDTTSFRLHFKNEGFDAVLTSELVSSDKEQRYEPGYGYSGYGGGFYGNYGRSYNNMYSPGYTYTTTTIRIETNLYDTKTEKIIWSGISETFDPSNDMDAIRSLNRALTSVLNKQGYFYDPKAKKKK